MFDEAVTKDGSGGGTTTLSFEVSNVIGTKAFAVSEVDATLPAEVVARGLAEEMALPQNVPWQLRDDDSAEFLDGAREIGSQVESGAHLSLTPKAHLG